MLTQSQIDKLFANAYYSLALDPKLNMVRATELLENLRPQLRSDRPYEIWHNLKLDVTADEIPVMVPVLLDFVKQYLKLLLVTIRQEVTTACSKSKQEGWEKFLQHYTEALINFFGEVYGPLAEQNFDFSEENKQEISELRDLNRWILEGRWVDTYPVYKKLAVKKELSSQQQISLRIILGQIELYYFPNPELALQSLKEIEKLEPENIKLKKAFAEYDLQFNQTDQAKTKLTSLLFQNPDDFTVYNFLGDCYKKDKNFKTAEEFYNDGIRHNIIQVESYGSLLKLYAEEEFFKEKKDLIPDLLEKIKAREYYPAYNNAYYDGLRAAANAFLVNNIPAQAQKFYQRAIKWRPLFVTAHLDLAYMKINQKKYEDAETIFKNQLVNNPACYDVHWGLSYLYETWDKQDDAIKAYERCMELRPEWITDQINNFIGNIYFKKQQFDVAITYYEKAIAINPLREIYKSNKNDALENIALAAERENKPEVAEPLFVRIAESGNHNNLNKLGNFYYRTKRFDLAAQCYEKAIKNNPEHPTYHENLGLALEKLAAEKGDSSLLHKAESEYTRAVELEKTSGGSYNLLGYFYYEQGKYTLAIDSYLKAIDREPLNKTYLQNLVRAYGDNGQIDEAISYSNNLIEADPGNAQSHAQLSFYYTVKNVMEKALEKIEDAIKLDKNNDYVLRTAGYVYGRAGKDDKAIYYYEKVLEINKDDDSSLNGIGVSVYNKGDSERSIGYYEAAIKINPKGTYYGNLGLAYETLLKYEDAEKAYKLGLEKEPNLPLLYNNLGVLQYRQGKFDEAEANYKMAIKLGGQVPLYLDNLNILYQEKEKSQKQTDVMRN